MVSPRFLKKLSPLLAVSLGFLSTTTAQSEDVDVSSVTSTTGSSGSSASTITGASSSDISSITSAVSSYASLSTNSAGSVSTVYISGSDNETETESTTTPKPRLTLTGQPKSSSTLSVPSSMNGTETSSVPATSTSEEAEPTNTQPCNGWPEFCNRSYANLTQIAAHNSPFVQENNVAANQDFDTITQLNDGVRMLQVQVHLVNETFYMCHGSCEMLNAGLFSDWLRDVAQWVYEHPYDVVTLVIGNAKYTPATEYVKPFEDSGIKQFAYIPPKNPMGRGDWPTLGNMILTNQRLVVFMDYEANQGEVPYILDQFIHVWETPFDPTSREFPCVIDRPPDLTEEAAEPRMYMANHNLNTELQLLGNSILVPTRPLLNETNAMNGTGSLGLAVENCVAKRGRPPNWLLVDYYNVGNGSVFEVAAKWNNVTYEGPCCGFERSSGARLGVSMMGAVMAALASLALL